MRNHRVLPILVAAAVGFAAPSAMAQGAVEKFYKGKELQLYIGADAGGAYDRYARLIGRHLQKFVPGNPHVAFRNMPGAGSRKLSAWLYNVAPRDGLILGAIAPGAILGTVFGDAGKVKYDPLEFDYVGSANVEVYLCIAWKDAPVKTFEQVFTKRMILGTSRLGGGVINRA